MKTMCHPTLPLACTTPPSSTSNRAEAFDFNESRTKLCSFYILLIVVGRCRTLESWESEENSPTTRKRSLLYQSLLLGFPWSCAVRPENNQIFTLSPVQQTDIVCARSCPSIPKTLYVARNDKVFFSFSSLISRLCWSFSQLDRQGCN